MSDQNTFRIPTASEVASEVVAKLSQMGLIVPGKAMDIHEAAKYLDLHPKIVRGLVEMGKIKCANATLGSGQSANLRFSVIALEKYLRGE